MARYNRIFKKKADTGDMLVASPASLIDFLRGNMNALALALGVIALATAGAYGTYRYITSSKETAQNRLYHASRIVPSDGATVAGSDEAVKALKEFVEKGGPSELVIQGRLELGALYTRKGDHLLAVEQYSAAVKEAKKGGLLWELASAGEAYSLGMAGKHAEAAAKFKELSETAKYYPRQELVYSYSLSLAAFGDKSGAAKALNRLKTEFPGYMPQDYVGDTIARVESGRLSVAQKSVEPAGIVKPQAPASVDKSAERSGG
jgi:hypothetical protein